MAKTQATTASRPAASASAQTRKQRKPRSAFAELIATGRATQRLVRWLTPALALSLTLNGILAGVAVALLMKEPEHEHFAFIPGASDAVPMQIVDAAGNRSPPFPIALEVVQRPLSEQRVAHWGTMVSDRLFDFSYSDYGSHFRDMSIYFTEQGFEQFRQALIESNWLDEIEARRAVLSGEVSTNLRVTQFTSTYWDLTGQARIVVDQPGHKVAVDTKQLSIRIRPGDPTAPASPPDDPFPATNWLGLKIDKLIISG